MYHNNKLKHSAIFKFAFYFIGLFLSYLLLSTTISKEQVTKVTQFDRTTDSLALVSIRERFYRSCDTSKIRWNLNEPVSMWYGVTIDTNDRVVKLELGNACLEGIFPPEIGKLTRLKVLNFSHNSLEKNLPPEIGHLTQLTFLDLSYNSIDSGLPAEMEYLEKLTHLNLEAFSRSGIGREIPIPSVIENLTQLTFLNLSENQIEGNIPAAFGNLTNLDTLDLSSNRLEGIIPPEIKNLTKLSYLNMSNNRLLGEIPIEIGSLTKLKHLDMSHFSLIENGWAGSIPTTIGNLSELIFFNLSGNALIGDIPIEIGNLVKLETMELNNNSLSRNIPTSIGNLSKLRTLNLSHNLLSGNIPEEIGNIPLLEVLDLNSNLLSEHIPIEIVNLSNLRILDLSHNLITGGIPLNIGDLVELTYLNLSFDTETYAQTELGRLAGEIPLSIGKLEQLTYLNLAGNRLSGEIPNELGNLTKLRYLDFTGGINSFGRTTGLEGDIPSEIGQLIELRTLNLSNNQLGDSIPLSLSNLTQLSQLSLHRNQLVGRIPSIIGNLTQLTQLSLNQNNLMGEIPPQIGNLTQLRQLDLRFNQLTGKVPVELKDLNLSIDLWGNSLSEIPDMRNGNLTFRSISYNHFTFDDILRNLFLLEPRPQKPFFHEIYYEFDLCDNPVIDLKIDADVEHNEYTWYKNDTLIHIGLRNRLNLRSIFSQFSQYEGIYTVSVTNPNVPSLTINSSEIIVELDKKLPAPDTMEIDSIICLGSSIQVADTFFDCSKLNRLLPISDSITGCITIYDIQLTCTDCRAIERLPTAITPNGDGKNESFIIPQLLVQPTLFPNNELSIYDVHGQIQYQQSDYRNNWRGQDNSGVDLSVGTYFYVFKYNGGKPLMGKVTVVR